MIVDILRRQVPYNKLAGLWHSVHGQCKRGHTMAKFDPSDAEDPLGLDNASGRKTSSSTCLRQYLRRRDNSAPSLGIQVSSLSLLCDREEPDEITSHVRVQHKAHRSHRPMWFQRRGCNRMIIVQSTP